jgi:hypothetical protein
MGKFSNTKVESRTPFLEKELALNEDLIFYVTGVRESGPDAPEKKWYLDIATVSPCTCYGTWEKQRNGTNKLMRATDPQSLFTISFKSLPYRDKNFPMLKRYAASAIAEGQGGYGPMRLLQEGKAIDPDDADDMADMVSFPQLAQDEGEEFP